MASRETLQATLENLLGSRNVYFQPPASVSINYPAIIYKLNDLDIRYADNKKYSKINCYQIMLIEKSQSSMMFDRIIDLDYCTFSSKYTADNLYHTIFKIFW